LGFVDFVGAGVGVDFVGAGVGVDFVGAGVGVDFVGAGVGGGVVGVAQETASVNEGPLHMAHVTSQQRQQHFLRTRVAGLVVGRTDDTGADDVDFVEVFAAVVDFIATRKVLQRDSVASQSADCNS
jgi:hypothetical protein